MSRSANEENGPELVRCESYPEVAPRTEPEQWEPTGPGVEHGVRIFGIEGTILLCWTGAHPEKDHTFRIGKRKAMVSRNLFNTKAVILPSEIRWEEIWNWKDTSDEDSLSLSL